MCGIAGWLGRSPRDPTDLAVRVQDLLRHRGPDSSGFDHGGGWGMIFRRLAILDLSDLGHQPMSSACGRYRLVFNGEIYNYIELRAELESRGETFVGQSDTEVLLRLFMREGVACLPRLNGMFAVAFVDTTSRRFILARDRLGQKPLYLRRGPDGVRFASELKALLAWPGTERHLDLTAVTQYLALSYLPTETCILEGYEKLPPGHHLSGSLDDPAAGRVERYWSMDINGEGGPSELAEDDYDELLELLTDATRIRLRSDVPVGIFLSGGIDSGLIASLAAKQGNTDGLLALTVGFDDDHYDETDLARSVADKAGLAHRVVPMAPTSLDQVDEIAWFFDEPFADPSALPTIALCHAARDHATVFLAGDGGDEAFGGYARYLATARYAPVMRATAALSPLLRGIGRLLPSLSTTRYRLTKLGLPNEGMAAAFDQIPNDPVMSVVLANEVQVHADAAGRPLWDRWATIPSSKEMMARQQALDYELYLPDDILVKVDRASMANSIEVRSPFLDYRVTEWAAALPRAALSAGSEGKVPLRRLGRLLLPPDVGQASKRGFGAPLDEWFASAHGVDLVTERLLGPGSPLDGILDPSGVATVLDAHTNRDRRRFGSWLWRLLVLDAWARNHLTVGSPGNAVGRTI